MAFACACKTDDSHIVHSCDPVPPCPPRCAPPRQPACSTRPWKETPVRTVAPKASQIPKQLPRLQRFPRLRPRPARSQRFAQTCEKEFYPPRAHAYLCLLASLFLRVFVAGARCLLFFGSSLFHVRAASHAGTARRTFDGTS